MGNNSGKFFDVQATKSLFDDFADSYEIYSNNSLVFQNILESFKKDKSWRGLAAVQGKNILCTTQNACLEEINEIHSLSISLWDSILEKFRLEVDAAPDARIDYDALDTINRDFQCLYLDFSDNSKLVSSRVNQCRSLYSKYGNITKPSFSGTIESYKDLCGGDEGESGYIYSCMNKLTDFDLEVCDLIVESGLKQKTSDLMALLEKRTLGTRNAVVKESFLNTSLIDGLESFLKNEDVIKAEEYISDGIEITENVIKNINKIPEKYCSDISNALDDLGYSNAAKRLISAFIKDMTDTRNLFTQTYINILSGKYEPLTLAKIGLKVASDMEKSVENEVSEFKQEVHDVNSLIDFVSEEAFDSMEKIANFYKKKSDLYITFKTICQEREAYSSTANPIYTEDNKTARTILSALDFKSKDDGKYYVDVNSFSLESGSKAIAGFFSFLTEKDCSGIENGIDALADYLGLDKEFCWQQVGGYRNLYDVVFDVATDMQRSRYVVQDDSGQQYTFWFWKGDYCNLGYGGECGVYEGDGKNKKVDCAVNDEIPMTMEIDYDGDGEYDYTATAESTWWITSFNPYAEEDMAKKGEEFDSSKMTITYTIDLSGSEKDRELFEYWESECENIYSGKERSRFDFDEDKYMVNYIFNGKGQDLWEN